MPFKTSLPPVCSCFLRGIEFELSERVREEPPDDRNQKTRKPKLHGECWNSVGFCFFWFVGFLVVCSYVFFGFLARWFFGSLVALWRGLYFKRTQKTKKPKNQGTKEPKNQKTKEPINQRAKKPKNQKTNTVPAFSVELCVFGFLVSVVGCSSRTRPEGSGSIPRKKQD